MRDLTSLEMGAVVLISLIFVSTIIIHAFTYSGNETMNLKDINCCDGKTCTDIYYTESDNLCHLILCEQTYGVNHEKCVYYGENLTWEDFNFG